MMATGFLGYALPWGQMSFWGATVITNLFSAIPYFGESIVTLLWGGYSVGNPTLNRFFSLHYLLPFVIAGVVVLHVWALHVAGQNNPAGVEPKTEKDTVAFTPYATIKDLFGTCCFLLFFAWFIFYMPNYRGDADIVRHVEDEPGEEQQEAAGAEQILDGRVGRERHRIFFRLRLDTGRIVLARDMQRPHVQHHDAGDHERQQVVQREETVQRRIADGIAAP